MNDGILSLTRRASTLQHPQDQQSRIRVLERDPDVRTDEQGEHESVDGPSTALISHVAHEGGRHGGDQQVGRDGQVDEGDGDGEVGGHGVDGRVVDVAAQRREGARGGGEQGDA